MLFSVMVSSDCVLIFRLLVLSLRLMLLVFQNCVLCVINLLNGVLMKMCNVMFLLLVLMLQVVIWFMCMWWKYIGVLILSELRLGVCSVNCLLGVFVEMVGGVLRFLKVDFFFCEWLLFMLMYVLESSVLRLEMLLVVMCGCIIQKCVFDVVNVLLLCVSLISIMVLDWFFVRFIVLIMLILMFLYFMWVLLVLMFFVELKVMVICVLCVRIMCVMSVVFINSVMIGISQISEGSQCLCFVWCGLGMFLLLMGLVIYWFFQDWAC